MKRLSKNNALKLANHIEQGESIDENLAPIAQKQKQLASIMSYLPKPEANDNLVNHIMNQVEKTTQKNPVWSKRIINFLLPKRSVLQLAGVALIFLVMGLWIGHFFSYSSDNVQIVRFVFIESRATQISVAGDFNNWQNDKHFLKLISDDLWAIELKLPKGRYEYMFWVDGAWRTDPYAQSYRPDGFGQKNAVIEL